MGRIWDWHKKVWNEPLIGWNCISDGKGNKDFRIFIGGSKFWYRKGIEAKKELECDTELLE